MPVTISRARTMYVGPMRVLSFESLSTGSADTQELPFHAATTGVNRLFGLTNSPLMAGAVNANPRITSVTANRPTITIDNGAANDQHLIRCWSW